MTQEGARMKQRIEAVERDLAMREGRPWPTGPAETERSLSVAMWGAVIFLALSTVLMVVILSAFLTI